MGPWDRPADSGILTVLERHHVPDAPRPFTWLHRVLLADGTECAVHESGFHRIEGLPDRQDARDQWFRYEIVMAGHAAPTPAERQAYRMDCYVIEPPGREEVPAAPASGVETTF